MWYSRYKWWIVCSQMSCVDGYSQCTIHYDDVIMTSMASQITSLMVVYSTVYSDADQRKQQSSASLAFVWGIHRDRWIPRTFPTQTASYAENVSIWWRLHVDSDVLLKIAITGYHINAMICGWIYSPFLPITINRGQVTSIVTSVLSDLVDP